MILAERPPAISPAGDQNHDPRCHAQDRHDDAAPGEAYVKERHQAARDQPEPEEDASRLLTEPFAAVCDEEQDAGHDAERGEDDAAFGKRDAPKIREPREDQPDAEKDVRPDLHWKPPF